MSEVIFSWNKCYAIQDNSRHVYKHWNIIHWNLQQKLGSQNSQKTFLWVWISKVVDSQIEICFIPRSLASAIVSVLWFDWFLLFLQPRTFHLRHCKPIWKINERKVINIQIILSNISLPYRSWTQGPTHKHCGNIHLVLQQSYEWLPSSTNCYHWYRHKCKSRGLHTSYRRSWNFGTKNNSNQQGILSW